jgi:DNA-binding MarR family transcriptional regulator
MMDSGPPLSEQAPRLGQVLDFMRLMWAIDHALQRISKRMKKTLGVTGPQRLVLRIVGSFPGISAGGLARLLHLHPSTLTGILARLEDGGLIRRRTDPSDGRRSLLELSRAGRRFDVEAKGTVEAAVARALARMSEAQLEATRAALRTLAASLASRSAARASVAPGPERRRRRARGRSRART